MAQVSVNFGAGAFSAKLYAQPGSIGTVIPLTNAQLGAQSLDLAATASAQVLAIIVPGNQLIVQNIGSIGYSPASANFPVAGSRYNAAVTTASDAAPLSLTFSLSPSNGPFAALTASSNSGTDLRTYVVTWLVAGNTFVWAANCFVSAINYEFLTNAEARATCDLVQQGGGTFGFSFI